jgi:hypothetical protein
MPRQRIYAKAQAHDRIQSRPFRDAPAGVLEQHHLWCGDDVACLSIGGAARIQHSLPIGHYATATAEHREPYDREVHVRFWERPRVKVPRATRHSRHFDGPSMTSGLLMKADIVTPGRHVQSAQAPWQRGELAVKDGDL